MQRMGAESRCCDMLDLDLDVMCQEKAPGYEPSSETRFNHYSLYYDDTLGPKKSPMAVYSHPDQDNGSYEEDINSAAYPSNPTADGTSKATRKLPTPPPPQSSGYAMSNNASNFQWAQDNNNGNGTFLKYYKEPTKRDSLMRALNQPAVRQSTAVDKPSRSRCKMFLGLLLGFMLTAIYVTTTYFIVKTVSAEICGVGVAENTNSDATLALLYGEVDFSSFNETWTSIADFQSTFISEVNKAVDETILSYHWKNATVTGLRSSLGRTTCHLLLNLRLDPNRRRGVDTFIEHVLQNLIVAQFSSSGASIRCIVFAEPDQFQTYSCNGTDRVTTLSALS